MELTTAISPVSQCPPSGREDISTVDDAVLISRVIEQDERAFAALYERYAVRLRRFVVRMTGTMGSADEVINDVMYVVWNKAATFRTGGKVSTWIFGIAHNKALKSLAKELRIHNPNIKQSLDTVDLVDGDNAYHRLETEGWLSAGMAALSPQHRATLELTYYHNMSCAEVAQVMDCNESTVKTRMFYARKKLRAALPDLAGDTASAGGSK